MTGKGRLEQIKEDLGSIQHGYEMNGYISTNDADDIIKHCKWLIEQAERYERLHVVDGLTIQGEDAKMIADIVRKYEDVKHVEMYDELEKELDKVLDVGLRMEGQANELEIKVKRYEEVLKDFAEYGTRHDTNPTTDGDVLHLMQYIQSMDRYVREKAKQALEEE